MNLRADQALLLQKNSPAPYTGLLAPVNYVKDLERRADLAKMYKGQLDHNKDCLPELSSIEPAASSLGFWEGTIVGAMLTAFVAILIRH